jgi:hypothetical protein
VLSSTKPVLLPAYLSIPSPSALLCYAWYPGATIAAPETYCFVKANRDEPVHLIDGTSGRVCPCASVPPLDGVLTLLIECRQLRASYPVVDHRERFVAPHSLLFSHDGSQYVWSFIQTWNGTLIME